MAKKKGSQRPKGKVAARRPLDNPFEVLKSHKKFDVLGRKKEKNQNKLKQRGAATELVRGRMARGQEGTRHCIC